MNIQIRDDERIIVGDIGDRINLFVGAKVTIAAETLKVRSIYRCKAKSTSTSYTIAKLEDESFLLYTESMGTDSCLRMSQNGFLALSEMMTYIAQNDMAAKSPSGFEIIENVFEQMPTTL